MSDIHLMALLVPYAQFADCVDRLEQAGIHVQCPDRPLDEVRLLTTEVARTGHTNFPPAPAEDGEYERALKLVVDLPPLGMPWEAYSSAKHAALQKRPRDFPCLTLEVHPADQALYASRELILVRAYPSTSGLRSVPPAPHARTVMQNVASLLGIFFGWAATEAELDAEQDAQPANAAPWSNYRSTTVFSRELLLELGLDPQVPVNAVQENRAYGVQILESGLLWVRSPEGFGNEDPARAETEICGLADVVLSAHDPALEALLERTTHQHQLTVITWLTSGKTDQP